MSRSSALSTSTEENFDALEAVRSLESLRIHAIRANDTGTMRRILDDQFLYISSTGQVYDKERYIRAVHTHRLTYSEDIELTETEHRVDGDLVIMAGMMHGHARLDGERQVYHLRSMRVWRRREAGWKLLAWQSSGLW
jgi:ketosteroid isomerase-like protein